jgi:hypothetical protein
LEVAKALLLGPESIKDDDSECGSKSIKATNASLWHVSNTTPGLIATSAIVVSAISICSNGN